MPKVFGDGLPDTSDLDSLLSRNKAETGDGFHTILFLILVLSIVEAAGVRDADSQVHQSPLQLFHAVPFACELVEKFG